MPSSPSEPSPPREVKEEVGLLVAFFRHEKWRWMRSSPIEVVGLLQKKTSKTVERETSKPSKTITNGGVPWFKQPFFQIFKGHIWNFSAVEVVTEGILAGCVTARIPLRWAMDGTRDAASQGRLRTKHGSLVWESNDTLWLCQNSYWKWPVIVDFPIKNGDFP